MHIIKYQQNIIETKIMEITSTLSKFMLFIREKYIIFENFFINIFITVFNDHAAVVDKLLDHKADLNSRSNTLETLLLTACLLNRLDVVELLCTKGADVSTQYRDGNTALHLAVGNNSVEITEVLLRHGAELITNKYGLTPSDIAKKEEYYDIVAVLEMQGMLITLFFI